MLELADRRENVGERRKRRGKRRGEGKEKGEECEAEEMHELLVGKTVYGVKRG